MKILGLSSTKCSCKNNVCLRSSDSTYFVDLPQLIISNDLFLSTATLENERERGDLSVCLRLAVEKSAKQELSKMVNCKTSTIKANIPYCLETPPILESPPNS